MKKSITIASLRAVLGFWFIVSLVVMGNVQTVKAEEALTVEGEWELISANKPESQKNIGGRVSISRKSDGYDVKWSCGGRDTFSGSETRISRTSLQDLGEAAGVLPPSVRQQVAGQIVPIDVSLTLSGDGRFLQEAADYILFYWYPNIQRFDHYEIKPGDHKWTFKRVSVPPLKDKSKIEPSKNTSIDAGPSPQEISVQVQQRQKEAHDLNEQGVQYYNNKQWQQAANAFKAALDKNPDDKTIHENYKQAVAALAAETAERRTTPLTGAGPAGTAGGHTALDQAHTSDKETRQGLESGGLENIKEQSNKVFDKPVPLQSSGINPAVDLRNVGKAPLPTFVRNDKEIIQMQKTRDAFLATQQKKDAELAQIRKQIEAEPDSAKKGDLMVKAAQIKAESSQAEYEAALKDKDIQKRAKLLIDTHVEEAPPTPGDQKTTPPDAQKTGH